MFLPESEIFLWIKPKKEENFCVESLDHCRRLKVRELRQEVFFVMSLRPSDHMVTQHLTFIKFLSISLGFSHFFARISYFKFLEFKEFNKTIIPFALVGYATGYCQLGATGLVGYLPSHIQRALME